MAGIMKFFKPTESAGGSSKKCERVPLNATAREPFSPLGNTEVAQRAALQPADHTDSDVELVDDDVVTGSKRKRGGNGASVVAGGQNSAANNSLDAAAPKQQHFQQKPATAGCLEACETVATADVRAATVAETETSVQLEAASAPVATDQVLSPDIAAVQPTPKRQRLPDDGAATGSSQRMLPQQQLQQQARSNIDDVNMADAAPQGPLGTPGAAAPADSGNIEPQEQQHLTPPPQPLSSQQQQQHLHPSPSQQSTGAIVGPSAAGASAEDGVGGTAAAGPSGPGTGTAGAAAKSGGAGPATLPADMDVGATVEALRWEQAELEAALEEEQLLSSGLQAAAASSEGGRLAAMPAPAELCTWLEGRTQPLSALVGQLEGLLPPGADTASSLRTSLVDLAQRKCYSAKEAPLEGVAASEDSTPGRLWVWEVREPKKHLPADKPLRKLVEAQRKRRKELRERLVAVVTAAETLSSHQALFAGGPPAPGTKAPSAATRRASETRAAKAWNRLSKLPDLAAVEGMFRSTTGALEGAAAGAAGGGTARKERERKAQQDREEKARQREEEARAKEAKRLQEEEAKRRAREAAVASKAGFKSKEGLRKSQNLMESFFKRPGQAKAGGAGTPGGGAAAGTGAAGEGSAPAAATASGAAGDAVMTLSGAPSGTLSQPMQHPLQPQQHQPLVGGSSQPAAATPPTRGTRGMFNFSKAVCRQPDSSVVAALDADAGRLPLPAEELARELQVNHERWRCQRAARKRMTGVPPTWARRPTAPTDIRVLAAQYYGDVAALGLAPEGLRTWRRKLIAFPQKESVRPPYYGSFGRSSTSVTGRRPFGRDTTLDYEVASDEEWEEEPEGESLSDSGDEADSQAGGAGGEGGEEEDDGFIVGDDHLSDDEGAQLSGDPDDPMDVDGAAAKAAGGRTATTVGAVRHMDPRLQQLEAAIDRVRANNRPVLLVKPSGGPAASGLTTTILAAPGASPAPAAPAAVAPTGFTDASVPLLRGLSCQLRSEPRPGLNTGLDPALLGAFRPVVHRPDVVLAPPLELDVFSAHAAALQGGGAAGWAAGPGATPSGLQRGITGTEEGTLAAAFAAAAAGGLTGAAEQHQQLMGHMATGQTGGPVGRAPGSGHRGGRPPTPGLSEAMLTALAEFMEACAERKMEKVVEGFLATLPPGPKQPPKTKLREAVKRLGAWSVPQKKWVLQGGSVPAAVAFALEAAAAAAAAAASTATPGVAAGGGTPLVDGAPLSAGPAAVVAAAAALARCGVMGAAGLASTPTPGLLPNGLPAPTPAPRLGPLPPTPSTVGGGAPLLAAPACTPLDGGAQGLRPTGHNAQQHLMPQHLAQALAKLAAEAPAASPLPSGVTGAATATPNGGGGGAAGGPGGSMTPGSMSYYGQAGIKGMPPPAPRWATTPVPPPAAPSAPQGPATAEPMDCDGGAAEQQPRVRQEPTEAAAAGEGQIRGGLPGGNAIFGVSAAAPDGPAPINGSAQDGSRGEVDNAACGPCGHDRTSTAAAAGEQAAQQGQELLRPMPGALPSPSELTLLGTSHPYWRDVTSWVLGGGGPECRGRKHGPSWAEVSRALAVFEAGELEPRLGAIPLDVVRALVAICQHRQPSHLRSGAFKALGNIAVALAAAASAPAAAVDGDGVGADHLASGRPHLPASRQPSRCAPQPVTLPALWRLPGLMEALRRGCCRSDPDSETDKAARGAARMLAALVGVEIRPLSAAAPFESQQRQQQHNVEEDAAAGGASAAAARAVAAEPVLSLDVEAAAAAFRLRVAANPQLHAVLWDVATKPPGGTIGASAGGTNDGAGPRPSPARCVFHAHMLLALQRLLRDPFASLLVTKPKARVEKERAAAAEGRPALAPPSLDLEARWAARLLQSLAVAGRDVAHPGCRKGTMQCAVALLEHPRLAGLMAAAREEEPQQDGGAVTEDNRSGPRQRQPAAAASSNSWGKLLSGNDPRTQLPAVCLTLLASELRMVAPGSGAGKEQPPGTEDGDGAVPPALDKCTRVRVLLGLRAGERALRHLSAASSRQQLRQADTKAAVGEVRSALRDANGVLASAQEPLLRDLVATVTALADELA